MRKGKSKRKSKNNIKVTRSVYMDSDIIDEVEELSMKSGEKNFNREAIRMLKAQIAYEKDKSKSK